MDGRRERTAPASREPVVLVAGPTASGKSALALNLAERFGGVIINADSMQVYRELRVLTARPGPDEEARVPHRLSRVPHRLYGVMSAAERCSAGRWRDLALAEIADAAAAGRLPIVVGGTGLYIRALLKGLAPVPPIPPAVRAQARALHAELGVAAFHARLAERDPAGAARLRPSDRQRVIRAYEVVEATGRTLGDWQCVQAPDGGFGGLFAALVLSPPRAALYAACNERVEAMVAAGALAEVEALLALDLDPSLPAMRALGVREFARHLRGEIDLAAAIRLAQGATRRYAKRQVTWFRHQMPGATVIEARYGEAARSEAARHVERLLMTIDRAQVTD